VLPRCAALLLALAAAFSALPADAFCRSTTCTMKCQLDENGCKKAGVPLRWTSGCVGISLSKKGSSLLPSAEIRRVVAASLASWSSLDCAPGSATIGYRSLADVVCNAATYNEEGGNANVIMFRDDEWPYQGTDNTLAFTTVTFDPQSGAILGADIEVNTAYNVFTTTDANVVNDLQAILTHELGHGLGLGHSSDPSSTMNAVYNQGDTAIRALAPDDVAAICDDYPLRSDAARGLSLGVHPATERLRLEQAGLRDVARACRRGGRPRGDRARSVRSPRAPACAGTAW
jgi:hypothetical protein